MAAEFVTTTKTNEIPVGCVTAFDVRDTRIAIANVGATSYAFDDACTHEQCSLTEEGELAGSGFHTKWEQLIVCGCLESNSYLAC